MKLFSLLKRKEDKIIENDGQQYNEISDYQTKYEILWQRIVDLERDLETIFKQDAYYLALQRMAYDLGDKNAEKWIDYHAGRLTVAQIILERLYVITNKNPSRLNKFFEEAKKRGIESLERAKNIVELLNYTEDLKKYLEEKKEEEKE